MCLATIARCKSSTIYLGLEVDNLTVTFIKMLRSQWTRMGSAAAPDSRHHTAPNWATSTSILPSPHSEVLSPSNIYHFYGSTNRIMMKITRKDYTFFLLHSKSIMRLIFNNLPSHHLLQTVRDPLHVLNSLLDGLFLLPDDFVFGDSYHLQQVFFR